MGVHIHDENRRKEKVNVALTSIIAASFLTLSKLIVGILTNSIGIISEAAHSLLDLGAAGITYFAVRISEKPADETHHYGHGKVEGLSAFVEVLLLLGTCAFIISEATHRIITKHSVVDVNWWAIGVMVSSIIIDAGRSTALYRVAKRTSSQALEADALHFSTDIWSSIVVIFGLLAYKYLNLPLADPIAALVVAAVVIYVSIKLALKTFDIILDKAPKNIKKAIDEVVINIPEVRKIEQLRVRSTGAITFADMILCVDNDLSFEEAHNMAHTVEEKIRTKLPRTDITIHLNPADANSSICETTNTKDKVESVLNSHTSMFSSYHNLNITKHQNRFLISVHIEMDKKIKLHDAHVVCDHLEEEIEENVPDSDVTIHIEPDERNKK